jgi:PhnB protein
MSTEPPAPVPEHLHTVTPRLVVSDGQGAIDFYVDAFAAEVLGEPFTDPDGGVIHAEVRIGDSVVMITEQRTDGGATTGERASGEPVTAIMATYWPDVDTAWARAIEAGAEVMYPLADQFYGERGGRLRDPFGQQWMLSTRTEELSADELERRGREAFSG